MTTDKPSALDELIDEAESCWSCHCAAEDQTCMCSDDTNHNVIAARAELAAMRELLRDVATSGVEFDDPGIKYVTVQIDREMWNQLAAYRSEAT